MPNVVEGRWLLNLYPEAAEAGGCFQSAARPGTGSADVEPDLERSVVHDGRRGPAEPVPDRSHADTHTRRRS